MRYILEPWQQHAASDGDVIILRAMRPWDQVGWTVATFSGGQPRDAGLGVFPTLAEAEQAARVTLGAH